MAASYKLWSWINYFYIPQVLHLETEEHEGNCFIGLSWKLQNAKLLEK